MKLVLASKVAAHVEPRLPSPVQVVRLNEQGDLDGDVSDAEVYFHDWSADSFFESVLARLPALRWLHVGSAGIDHLLTPTVLGRDLLITNSAGAHAVPIAEFVLACILSHAKRLPTLSRAFEQHAWMPESEVQMGLQELMGTPLLIVGAGGIGRAIAQRASAFGLRVWGSRRHPQPLPGFEQVVGVDEWRKLLPAAKYVVLATPLTQQTRHLFDTAAFQLMPADAYLINIARGEVVDETALQLALKQGWIAGAALDTLSTEPLPSGSPLWSLPNLLITPHCSATSGQTLSRLAELFLSNLALYQSGAPLQNVVDKSAGY